MSHAKPVSTRKRKGKAMPVFGRRWVVGACEWCVRRETRRRADAKYRNKSPSFFG